MKRILKWVGLAILAIGIFVVGSMFGAAAVVKEMSDDGSDAPRGSVTLTKEEQVKFMTLIMQLKAQNEELQRKLATIGCT